MNPLSLTCPHHYVIFVFLQKALPYFLALQYASISSCIFPVSVQASTISPRLSSSFLLENDVTYILLNLTPCFNFIFGNNITSQWSFPFWFGWDYQDLETLNQSLSILLHKRKNRALSKNCSCKDTEVYFSVTFRIPEDGIISWDREVKLRELKDEAMEKSKRKHGLTFWFFVLICIFGDITLEFSLKGLGYLFFSPTLYYEKYRHIARLKEF